MSAIKAAYVGIDLLYPALPALAEAGCEILRVFTCETDNVTEFNTDVCSFAREHGIPLQTRRMIQSDLDDLIDLGCGLVLCGGYYYRLPVRPELYMVNIHPALLPVGRGAWPMPVTLLRGLTQSGVTFHKITPALDEGEILLQECIPVAPDEDLQGLMKKQRALLPGMVKKLVRELPELWNTATPQDPSKAEYWPCPVQADWTVREDMAPADADRILRAFYGYEVLYERSDGERRELIWARLADAPEPGSFTFPCGGKYVCAKRARSVV